jgi:hypothetical protein
MTRLGEHTLAADQRMLVTAKDRVYETDWQFATVFRRAISDA